MTTRYAVSTYQDDLVPDEEAEGRVRTYDTAENAIKAIKADLHGELGTRYVLKIDLEVVATASRNWELRKDA